LIALIAAGLLLTEMAEAWSQSSPDAPSEQIRSEQSVDGTDCGCLQGEQAKSFWKRAITNPVDLSTLVVAAFTGVLAISTVGLWIVSWRGFARQRQDTRILQRAYVGVDPGGIKLWSDGSELVAHVLIKNAGNLPASNAKWAIYLRADTTADEIDFPIEESHVDGFHFIVPHGTITFGNRVPRIKLQDALAMRDAGPCYFYVWGRVDYLDGFNRWRKTGFCHRYNWGQTKDYGVGQYELTADKGRSHRKGNYTT
jgi:hypothetical protein